MWRAPPHAVSRHATYSILKAIFGAAISFPNDRTLFVLIRDIAPAGKSLRQESMHVG